LSAPPIQKSRLHIRISQALITLSASSQAIVPRKATPTWAAGVDVKAILTPPCTFF
jgi:hypothetical protein